MDGRGVARRRWRSWLAGLSADRIALVFGLRDREAPSGALAGLPTIPIGGLPDDAALELLSTRVGADVDTELAQRIVAETSGCPLALLELASELTDEQLRGGRTVSEPLPIGRRLEEHFLRQVRALDDTLLSSSCSSRPRRPPATHRWCVGSRPTWARTDRARTRRSRADCSDTARGIAFRHPLIRSAIYGGAPTGLRRRVHTALAADIDRSADPDRRAQHLAARGTRPTRRWRPELEEAAHRAGQRGGYSAESSFLLRPRS